MTISFFSSKCHIKLSRIILIVVGFALQSFSSYFHPMELLHSKGENRSFYLYNWSVNNINTVIQGQDFVLFFCHLCGPAGSIGRPCYLIQKRVKCSLWIQVEEFKYQYLSLSLSHQRLTSESMQHRQ